MNKVIALAVVLGIATVVYAERDTDLIADPLEKQTALSMYFVSGNGQSAVLLDTVSGKTWTLRNGTTWLPLEKIDDADEAQKFLEIEKTRKSNRKQELERARMEQEK